MSFALIVLLVWGVAALAAIALVLLAWAAFFGNGTHKHRPSSIGLLKRPVILGPAKPRVTNATAPAINNVIHNVRFPING